MPPYVLDFCCPDLKLAIEIDGETHLGKEANDEHRTRYLESQGIRVVRFWNTEVYDEMDAVLEKIWQVYHEMKA